MFSSLAKLATNAPLAMTIVCDAQGIMTVTVFPQSGGTITQPLSLTATPTELDEGFVEAVSTYEGTIETVAAQVAAVKSELETAGKSAIAASKKSKTASPTAKAQAIDDGSSDDVDDEVTVDDKAPTTAVSAVADDPMKALF